MKYLVLIQARCGSTRFPNKVLADLSGKSDLQRVLERVKNSKLIDEVMVITSIEKNNLPLIELCAKLQTRVFVGSEDDVLDRYYQAARLIKPEYVIRITADCPLFDWRYLDYAIETMETSADYRGAFEDTFPDGLDVEIMKFEALKRSWKEARLASEREHVTQYIRKHSDIFKLQNLACPIEGIGHHRWTLDEKKDYEMISAVFSHFVSEGKEDFVTEDIIEFLDNHPEIVAINQDIGRNEGLAKSIREDKIVNSVD